MISTSSVANEVDAHIRKCGGGYSAWYVGIAADPSDRLFNDHNVQKKGDAWIQRDAGSEEVAREVEQHFISLGCQGGGGGGSSQTRHVYAYKVTAHTRQ